MQVFRTEFRAMGCSHEIIIASSDEKTAANAMQAATREVQRIEQKYSRYRVDSVIGRINGSAGDGTFIDCDQETNELLEIANTLHQASDGLFDATSGPLRRCWDFTKPELASQDKLEAVLPLINWNKVVRNSNGVRLAEKGMEIDFGGFGKEFACDRAAKALADHGIAHGYVNLAGDIRAVGPQPDGQPWQIGVQDPRNAGSIIARIPLAFGALATSGDYEKYIDVDGRRYCHVLNPRTGYPVNFWSSVSVSAPTALQAGACSTIAMLKEGEALAFLTDAKQPYLLVGLDGKKFTNPTTIQ